MATNLYNPAWIASFVATGCAKKNRNLIAKFQKNALTSLSLFHVTARLLGDRAKN